MTDGKAEWGNAKEKRERGREGNRRDRLSLNFDFGYTRFPVQHASGVSLTGSAGWLHTAVDSWRVLLEELRVHRLVCDIQNISRWPTIFTVRLNLALYSRTSDCDLVLRMPFDSDRAPPNTPKGSQKTNVKRNFMTKCKRLETTLGRPANPYRPRHNELAKLKGSMKSSQEKKTPCVPDHA